MVVAECVHHWLLPSPNGSPVLTATCKKCGDSRDFKVSARDEFNTQRLDFGKVSDDFIERRAALAYADNNPIPVRKAPAPNKNCQCGCGLPVINPKARYLTSHHLKKLNEDRLNRSRDSGTGRFNAARADSPQRDGP